jgi:hypothetical protein
MFLRTADVRCVGLHQGGEACVFGGDEGIQIGLVGLERVAHGPHLEAAITEGAADHQTGRIPRRHHGSASDIKQR